MCLIKGYIKGNIHIIGGTVIIDENTTRVVQEVFSKDLDCHEFGILY